jgi:hypothetical protein
MVIILGLLSCMWAPVVTGGELRIIDKSNYQQVQGLVPDPALKWFDKGDWMMRVGDLDFDWSRTQPNWILESRTANVAKYDLNDDSTIVDAKTGQPAGFIQGIPFPDIDPKDPKAATKIMYNGSLVRQCNGPLRTGFRLSFLDGKSDKMERSILVNWWSYAFAGWPAAATMPNPDSLEFYSQILIKEPYDMAGTSLMTWRYLDSKPDMLFGYVPAIRRVRRLTPAGRSDAMFGSDFARDDGNYVGYDGKIGDVEWKLVGETTILGGFNSATPQEINVNDSGEWVVQGMDDRESYMAFGYEPYSKKYYSGEVAPWCQTNTVWTPRPVYIIEGRHKNPYYNYGRQIHWVDKETFVVYWKQIFDRADEYWKMFWTTWGVAASQDGKRAATILSSLVLDERLQHCSAVEGYGKDCFYTTSAKAIDLNRFSLAGFTKISK